LQIWKKTMLKRAVHKNLQNRRFLFPGNKIIFGPLLYWRCDEDEVDSSAFAPLRRDRRLGSPCSRPAVVPPVFDQIRKTSNKIKDVA
jgi:hypothetical protein